MSDPIKKVLEKEFGEIRTSQVDLRAERYDHIKQGHDIDALKVREKFGDTINDPDMILRSPNSKGTALFIKHLHNQSEPSKLNIVLRLALKSDNRNYNNSVITGYAIKDKRLQKLVRKNKVLYKRSE